MSITTYAELQTSVANWLHRTDLTAIIPDFITLAEAKLSSDINARSMETRTALMTVASDAYVTLPTDMLEMRRLVLTDADKHPLAYRSPDQIDIDYPFATTGRPQVFAVIAGQLQLAPIPDAVYTMELTYAQRIPALSVSNTTNWLLTAYPNAYLYASLMAAQPFIVADGRTQLFQMLYQEAINGINSIDWYSGSTMTVRAK